MGDLETIRRKLERYKKSHSPLSGFVLDFPKDFDKKTKAHFYKQVGGMISSFGCAIRLPSKRVMVLIPKNYDCSLVAHRLCGNLGAETMLFFEAANIDIILDLMKKY
jgi:hypothetical protein